MLHLCHAKLLESPHPHHLVRVVPKSEFLTSLRYRLNYLLTVIRVDDLLLGVGQDAVEYNFSILILVVFHAESVVEEGFLLLQLSYIVPLYAFHQVLGFQGLRSTGRQTQTFVTEKHSRVLSRTWSEESGGPWRRRGGLPCFIALSIIHSPTNRIFARRNHNRFVAHRARLCFNLLLLFPRHRAKPCFNY